jgi:Ca-activated chloride channel family protein
MKKYFEKIKIFTQKNKKLLVLLFLIKTLIKIGVVVILLVKTKDASAQTTNSLLRTGNKNYHQQKYNQATENYTKALSKEPNNEIAIFNQADAMYQLGEYEKAISYFDAIAKQSKNKSYQSKSYHNLGNTFYKQEQYEKSVEAYKQALKINPDDKETKYNLMMAMAKLKKESQQQKQNQQQKQEKNNQNNQQNQQQKDNKDNKDKQDKQEQENAGKMSNEEAQRLLEALQNEEGKTQEKLQQQNANGKKTKVAKDW